MFRAKGGVETKGEFYDDSRAESLPSVIAAISSAGGQGQTASFIKRQLSVFSGVQGQDGSLENLPEGHTVDNRTFTTNPVAFRPKSPVKGRLIRGDIPEIDLSKIGQSYFQGLVVSDGYITTSNEVSVVGSMWATGKNDESPVLLDGYPVAPGDIVVSNGSEIVLNQELLKKEGAEAKDITNFELKAWIE